MGPAKQLPVNFAYQIPPYEPVYANDAAIVIVPAGVIFSKLLPATATVAETSRQLKMLFTAPDGNQFSLLYPLCYISPLGVLQDNYAIAPLAAGVLDVFGSWQVQIIFGGIISPPEDFTVLPGSPSAANSAFPSALTSDSGIILTADDGTTILTSG